MVKKKKTDEEKFVDDVVRALKSKGELPSFLEIQNEAQNIFLMMDGRMSFSEGFRHGKRKKQVEEEIEKRTKKIGFRLTILLSKIMNDLKTFFKELTL